MTVRVRKRINKEAVKGKENEKEGKGKGKKKER